MIQKAQLSEKDAGPFLKSLKANYEKTQKKMETQIHRLVKDVLKKADIATSDDVKALKREIQVLRRELKAAQASPAAKPGKAAAAKNKSKPKAKTSA